MIKRVSLFSFFLLGCFNVSLLLAQQPLATDLYKQGEKAFFQNDYYLAIDFFLEAIEINSSYVEPYKGLMKSYKALGEEEKSFIYAQQILPYAQNDFDFYVLYADLLRKRGNYSESFFYLKKILDLQENHLEALLGMARLYKDQGNSLLAQKYYMFLFDLYPSSTQLPAGEYIRLLQVEGKTKEAISFIYKMENYYQASPSFAEDVSHFYLSQGDFERAEHYANHFLTLTQKLNLKEKELVAYSLLGIIALKELDFLKAELTLKQALSLKRDEPILNYLLGLSFYRQLDVTQSQDYFYKALELSKGEEVFQEALEATLFEPNIPLNNSYRSRLSQEYYEKASQLYKIYLYEKSLLYARQSIELDPNKDSARLLMAKIYRDLNYPILSFRELSFLKNERKFISDDLEFLYENAQLALVKTPAYKWGFKDISSLNRLYAERPKTKVALFYLQESSLLGSNSFLLDSLSRSLEREYSLKVANGIALNEQAIPFHVSRFSDAFRLVRENNLDYYFMITPYETFSKGFTIKADLYLANTAFKVKEFLVSRFNDKSRSTAIEQLSREIIDFIPLKGSFIKREGFKALINLGKIDKVQLEDKFVILNPVKVSFSQETGFYVYDEADVVGIATISHLGDFASEVSLEKKGILDIIDVNYILIPVKEDSN